MIRDCFARLRPLGEVAHRKILKRFYSYLAAGGMPQAVTTFVNGEPFQAIDLVKRSILDLYEEDINKYDKGPNRATSIYRSIPEQLTHHNSHFKIATIDKSLRYSSIADAVDFLDEAMIVNECLNATVPDVLLDLHVGHSNFKLYQADTGLLVTQAMRSGLYSQDSLYKALVFGHRSTNLGMIMENMVAQMLAANGHPLRFHEFRYRPKGSAAEKRYEIDFLIVRDRLICPIEVKSSGYRAHKSFDYFLEKHQVKCKERYVLYPKDLSRQGPVTYLPLYMTMCL